MSVVTVSLDGIDSIRQFLERSPEKATEAARLAVNYGAKRARQIGSKEMRKQVAFTAAYLSDSRFRVIKTATRSDLSAIVRGRDRPTSLARFATNRSDVGKQRKPAKVRVKPGASAKRIERSFLVNLRRGREATGNIGLAIRVPLGRVSGRRLGTAGLVPYDKPNKKTQAYLFYGPSVDQVFRSVRNQISAPVLRDTEREFYRQFTRLSK